jgi:type I restriction-modification system DNA methylase subunit
MEEQLNHSRNITIGDTLKNSEIQTNDKLRRKAASGKTYKERRLAIKLLKELDDPMARDFAIKLAEDRRVNRKTRRIKPNKFWE